VSRRIVCPECLRRGPVLYAEDVALGMRSRVVEIEAKKPERHTITLKTGDTLEDLRTVAVEHLSSIMCDTCGQPIPDGERCFAITIWRTPNEPPAWEKDYSQ